MSPTLFPRLLLLFALLFTQMGGLAHGISHTLADRLQDQSMPHDTLCELCAVYAQIGSAIGSHALTLLAPQETEALKPLIFKQLYQRYAFNPYPARAPPYSA